MAPTATPATSPPPGTVESARFAHHSERQFALLLDFYGVEWHYEPTTFVLEHRRDGRPLRAFRPDFYLPSYDLYIEVTTLRQKLVTKKNRKARELMEHYPGVQVKVLYQRDYAHLLVKYGLEGPPAPTGSVPAHEPGRSLLEVEVMRLGSRSPHRYAARP